MPASITIIGTGVSPDDLTARQRAIIERADILVGGRRLIEPFDHLACRKKVIDKNLKGVGDFLEEQMADHTIAVLTSGDPLFFGIGAFLVRRLGAERVRIMPNVSAVAAAFARIGEPWQEARVVSLHGRKRTGELLRYLASGETVAVYTDPDRGPAWLANLLVNNALPDVSMTVLEHLGTEKEKILRTTPEEASGMAFADLNVVILKPDPVRQTQAPLFPGMPDYRFAHENGLITKSEIRAVSLSRLRLFDRAVFWDLGAGSGSVSVEAGLFVTRGEIYAVEQKPDRIRDIRSNRSRFGIGNLEIVQARLPDGLADLPDPDRVFIGGGGKALTGIIRDAAERLKPAGIMVINTILIDNLNRSVQTLEDLGYRTDMVQVQVSRAKPMPFSRRMVAANPVWIITGEKP